jgi:hypothetical protein
MAEINCLAIVDLPHCRGPSTATAGERFKALASFCSAILGTYPCILITPVIDLHGYYQFKAGIVKMFEVTFFSLTIVVLSFLDSG